MKIKWKQGAFAEIRTLPDVMGLLDDHAESVATTANSGLGEYGYKAMPAAPTGGRVRGRAAVVTTTIEAMVHEARNHELAR